MTTMNSNAPLFDNSHNKSNPSGGNDNRSADDQTSLNQVRFELSRTHAGHALNPSASQQTTHQDPGALHSDRTSQNSPDPTLNFGSGDANVDSCQQQHSNQSKSRKDEITRDGCMNIKKPSYPPVTHRPAATSNSQPARVSVPPLVHQPSLTANLNNFEYHCASYPTIGFGKLVDMQKQKRDKQAAKRRDLNKRAVSKNQIANEVVARHERLKKNCKLPRNTQGQKLSKKEAAQKRRQETYEKKTEDDMRKEINGKQETIVRQQQTHQHAQPQTHIFMQTQHPQMISYNQIIHPHSLQQCYPAQQYATQCFPLQQYSLQPNMMYNVMAYPQHQYPNQYPAQPIMNDMMSFIQHHQPPPHNNSPPSASLPALTSKDTLSELKKKKKKKKKKVIKNGIIDESEKENPNSKNKHTESDLTMPPLPPPKELTTSPSFPFDYENIDESPTPKDEATTPLARESMPSPNPEMDAHAFEQNKTEESSEVIMASFLIDLNTAVVKHTTGHDKHPPLSTHPSLVATKSEMIHKSTTDDNPELSVSVPSVLAPKNERNDSPGSWNDKVADHDVAKPRALSMEAANTMVHTDSVKDEFWDDGNYIKCNESTDNQDSTVLRENTVDQAKSDHLTPDSEAAASLKYSAKSPNGHSADSFAMLYHTREATFSSSKDLHPDAPSIEQGILFRSAIIQERNQHPSVDSSARPQAEISSINSMKSSNGIISDDEEAAALKNPPDCFFADMDADQDLLTSPTATYPTDEATSTSTKAEHDTGESSRTKSNSDPASNRGISEETFETVAESDYMPTHRIEPRLEHQKENEILYEVSDLNSNNDARDGDKNEGGVIMNSLRASSGDTPDKLLSQVSRTLQTGPEGVQPNSPYQVNQHVDTDVNKVIDSKQYGASTKTTFDSNSKIPSSEDTTEDEDDDLSWDCMLMQLEAYRQRFGDLSVPLPQKNEENATQSGWYRLYVWVRNQRQKLSEGSLLPERSQKLQDLGLDLNPIPKHSSATPYSYSRTSKQKKKETKHSNKSKTISGPKSLAVSLTSKVSQKSLPTKLPLGRQNEAPQTSSQQTTNVTTGPSLLVGNNFLAPNLQQLMPSPFQQGNAPTQFIASQQSLQQMQACCQQFNNTAQAQYPVISAGHYQPMMNSLQPQVGQHMSGQGPYQEAFDRVVQFPGMNNSTHHSHIQQASEFQALHAPYQQFHNNIAPLCVSSIQDTDPQCQQTSPQDKQGKPGHRPKNATARVSKSKHELRATGRRSAVEPKGQESNPSGAAFHDHTQTQKNSYSKNKGLKESQDNPVVADGKNETEMRSLTDEAKEKPCTSDKANELRSGKFSHEEEEYCLAVINDFKLGLLDALPGQNICSYLAKKLGCTYLRISKKFHGIINLPPFAPISIKGSDEKTEQEVANARKRMKALYKNFRSSESTKSNRISSPDSSVPLNADSRKRASSIETEERPAKKLKPRPLEEQAKAAQAKREKAESLMKTYKSNAESTHALAASQPTHNLFAPQHQFQMSFNPLSTVLQQNFLQNQLHGNASNYRLQHAQNLDLMHKALFCQVNAYSGIHGVSQLPTVMTPSQGHESFKATFESAEKDIAAETLCAIRNTGKDKDE